MVKPTCKCLQITDLPHIEISTRCFSPPQVWKLSHHTHTDMYYTLEMNTHTHVSSHARIQEIFYTTDLDIQSCTHDAYYQPTSKLTGGGGLRGSNLITLDSTFGGGRKLFFPI